MNTSSTNLRSQLRRKESLNVMLLQSALQKVKDSEVEKLEEQNISVEDLIHAQKEGELKPWLEELRLSRTARMQISSAIASLPPSPTGERANPDESEVAGITPNPLSVSSTDLRTLREQAPPPQKDITTSTGGGGKGPPKLLRQGSMLSGVSGKDVSVPALKAAILPSELIVDFDQKLGTGCFGEVWRGTWNNRAVAVKLVNLSDVNERQEFLDRVAKADTIRHPNIVSYYGSSIMSLGQAQHACLVMELISPGSLSACLKKSNHKFPSSLLLSICVDVVTGLKHLHSRGIIHGDLALHNVLVSGDILSQSYEIKITAFGLSSEVLKGKEYYKVSPDAVLLSPIKWLAPELLAVDQKSDLAVPTKASDMWALAVVFWEIFNYGNEPYEEIPDDEVAKRLAGGTRLNNPEPCPKDLYDGVMAKCWDVEPNNRPSAKDVIMFINNFELGAANTDEEMTTEASNDNSTQASRATSPNASSVTSPRDSRVGSPVEYRTKEDKDDAESKEDKDDDQEEEESSGSSSASGSGEGMKESASSSKKRITKKVTTIKKGAAWGSKSSNGKLNIPADIAIGSQGNEVILCGRWLESVQVYDVQGNIISSFGSSGSGDGQFTGVTGVAVDKEGKIYATETTVFGLGKRRVQVFDKEGQFVMQFGSKGSGLGEFKEPRGIAVDGKGNIIVADSGNHRIQIFAPDGKFIGEFGAKGRKDGMLKTPWGVVVNSVGNILVTDKSNNRVQIFDGEGNHLYSFGKKGTKRGEFNEPRGIAVDRHDNIIVGDTMNERIQIFDRRGKYLKSLKVGLPYGVDVTSSGQILVCNTRRCVIQIIDYTVDNEAD